MNEMIESKQPEVGMRDGRTVEVNSTSSAAQNHLDLYRLGAEIYNHQPAALCAGVRSGRNVEDLLPPSPRG